MKLRHIWALFVAATVFLDWYSEALAMSDRRHLIATTALLTCKHHQHHHQKSSPHCLHFEKVFCRKDLKSLHSKKGICV